MIARDPRLALVRCAVLALTGRVAEARRLYKATGPVEFAADARGDDFEQRIDHTLVRGLLVVYGCEGFGTERARAPFNEARVAVDTSGLDSVVRGTFEYGLCLAHSLKAEFDLALWRAERTRACLGRTSSYLTLHVDLQVGAIAMAQGRVDDAVRWYARGKRVAKTQFLRDPSVSAHADVLAKELDLERGRGCVQAWAQTHLDAHSGAMDGVGATGGRRSSGSRPSQGLSRCVQGDGLPTALGSRMCGRRDGPHELP